MQLYTVVHELLAQEGNVLGVTRQTVECFAHHDIHRSGIHVSQQLLQSGTIAAVSGLLGVKVGRNHRPAEIVDQLHARGGLVRTG